MPPPPRPPISLSPPPQAIPKVVISGYVDANDEVITDSSAGPGGPSLGPGGASFGGFGGFGAVASATPAVLAVSVLEATMGGARCVATLLLSQDLFTSAEPGLGELRLGVFFYAWLPDKSSEPDEYFEVLVAPTHHVSAMVAAPILFPGSYVVFASATGSALKQVKVHKAPGAH